MTTRRHPLAAVAALALAACTETTAPEVGALFDEPSAIAMFRGVTIQSGLDPASAIYPYRPYFALANAGKNDLSILNAIDDTLVPAPILFRGVVYPVPGRPLLLVSADLGDRKPDLLAVVTAGDLPFLGGSRLEVIRTWDPDGVVEGVVELGGDVLALAALPFDPAAPGSVTIAAALAGDRVAVVTFTRSAAGDGTGIDVAGAQVLTSAPLGFQPLDLAVVPGDRTRVFAASNDPLPGGVLGVAEIDVTGTPTFVGPGLEARAPTRLVAAMRLREAIPLSSALDEAAFAGQPVVERIYAVLAESGCGLQAEIPCGVVALDPVTRALVPDPTTLTTMRAPYRAPLRVEGARALGATLPPAFPPSALEPQYAGTYLRIAAGAGVRQSTAAGGVATVDGLLTFLDLARWDVPSQRLVHPNVKATVTATRPTGTTGNQWLVLERADGSAAGHADPTALATAVRVTSGYTPTDRWTVTREGILPGLAGRRAEVGNDGAPWLALQQTGSDGSVQAAVRLFDPTRGVRPGDLVVIDPSGLGTCTAFEAAVADLEPPDAARPGGYVHLAPRSPSVPAWDRCLAELAAAPSTPGSPPFYSATLRAGGYVLVRGTGTSALHVGRPEIDLPFEVLWQDEAPLVAACPLPPARPWPPSPPACDAACRERCELLQRVRLARRIGYVVEAPTDLTGPAMAFTLALEVPGDPVPRDVALVIETAEGREPFRTGVSGGSPVDPRGVVPFDRSPWSAPAGVRLVVPYAGGVVLDATPTSPGGGPATVR